ncbi:TPA: hypothetical protein HA251_04955 [Candidatus Woesearchaeota archaeon]|nr:hypothetical protein [Candidatus Woesearchaeota archaeon]
MTLEERLRHPAVTLAALATTVAGNGAYFMTRKDRTSLPPMIANHVGDFAPTCFFAVNAVMATSMIANIVAPQLTGYPRLQRTVLRLPELSVAAFTSYVVLGETLCDIVPGNYCDPWDAPAAVLAAASGYVFAKGMMSSLRGVKPVEMSPTRESADYSDVKRGNYDS